MDGNWEEGEGRDCCTCFRERLKRIQKTIGEYFRVLYLENMQKKHMIHLYDHNIVQFTTLI